MPRHARVVVPNYPHHVVQRGHGAQPVFRSARDRKSYLDDLRTGRSELGCRLYAYCLMENHVHLIVDPGDSSETLGVYMKWVAGKHAMRINRSLGRRGSLWEGRYRSSVIATDRYLLACCRYVEMNPVRAGTVRSPEAYRWSSFRERAGLESPGWLDRDPAYLSFGSSPARRAARYGEWMIDTASREQDAMFRESLHRGNVTGGKDCVETIRRLTGRWLGPRRRGRPATGKRGTVPN